jgi:hypothetical protein
MLIYIVVFNPHVWIKEGKYVFTCPEHLIMKWQGKKIKVHNVMILIPYSEIKLL